MLSGYTALIADELLRNRQCKVAILAYKKGIPADGGGREVVSEHFVRRRIVGQVQPWRRSRIKQTRVNTPFACR
jgi:hypothetical protein